MAQAQAVSQDLAFSLVNVKSIATVLRMNAASTSSAYLAYSAVQVSLVLWVNSVLRGSASSPESVALTVTVLRSPRVSRVSVK